MSDWASSAFIGGLTIIVMLAVIIVSNVQLDTFRLRTDYLMLY